MDSILIFFLICACIGTLLVLINIFFGGFADHDVQLDTDLDGPGIFSFRSIIIFIAVFGAVGGLSYYNANSFGISSLYGILSGFAASILAWYLMKFAFKQQASSLISISDTVNKNAVVTTSIPENGIGEIMIETKGQRKYLSARELNNKSVNIHSKVKVIENQSNIIIVEKID